MALLAGAERVDGCLFGNGERSGNADLVTLALNMYSQGISPGLNFSDLPSLIKLVTNYTRIPVHSRHPYAGSLIFTAYSGGHQDGIKKGFEAMSRRHVKATREGTPQLWQMPYLPVDPTDFGFSYDAIRINSQSGKAGVAYVIEQLFGIPLPRLVQAEFADIIQKICDQRNQELTQTDISSIFRRTYHFDDGENRTVPEKNSRLALSHIAKSYTHSGKLEAESMYRWTVILDSHSHSFSTNAESMIEVYLAFLDDQLKCHFSIEESSFDHECSHITTVSFIKLRVSSSYPEGNAWTGVGKGADDKIATLNGINSAVNRAFDNRYASHQKTCF